MSEYALCLNTSTIRPASLPDKIRAAAGAGFTAVEPWNDEIDDYLRAGGTLVDLRQRIDDAGLMVASVIALGGWIDGDPAAWDECRRRMDQAAALGSPYIVASPPQDVVDIRRAAACYAELLALGRQAGVRPAMEFLGFVDGISTLADALAVADGADDLDATVVADVFHLMRGPGSIDDLLTLRGEQLAIFHVNDLPADPPPRTQTDHDRVLPGEGIADLPRVVAHLRAIGYRGPLSLELFNPGLWARDPAEVARVGIDRLRAFVEG